tara:strand:- start:511 stop:996 length:486 start_codon:yes stop_codon:yes gene_type:complete
MSRAAFLRAYRWILIVIVTSFVATGCTTIMPPLATSLEEPAMTDPSGTANEQSSCLVLVQSRQKPMRTTSMPWTEQSTVQSAVEFADVAGRFGNLEVFVVRTSDDADGRTQRMEAEYDYVQRKITLTSDYALRAGDRVYIKESSRPLPRIFRFVGALTGGD